MAEKRRNGLVRQFSVQNEKPAMFSLKKQLSIEQVYTVKELDMEIQDDTRKMLLDRPRLVRLAWGDNCDSSQKQALIKTKQITESVEIKKCTEHKRPTTAKLRTQKSLDRDSILYTRQELAERLRQAWIDREQNKQNLDIFLTHNAHEKQEDHNENESNQVDEENTTCTSSNNNAQTINDNNICKPKKHVLMRSETIDVPSNFISKQRNLDVKIPIDHEASNQKDVIEDKRPVNTEFDQIKVKRINSAVPKLIKQTSLNIDSSNQNNNLNVKPSSGMSRREAFQKRNNSAFNGSLCLEKSPKPPLTRTLSIPTKSDVSKPLFISTKRKLKTIKKRDRESCEILDEEAPVDKIQSKREARCKSAPGGDIVTMVSLVSPAGSDVEDAVEKTEAKSRLPSPEKLVKDKNAESVKTIISRKPVKQVSFQQSSIHAIRSFSASFPSRSNLATVTSNKSNQIGDREKRAPFETVEIRDAKRRHLITKRTTGPNSTKEMEECNNDENNINLQTKENVPNEDSLPEQTVQNNESSINDIISVSTDDQVGKSTEDPDTPKFESSKEKECWAMYKKMSSKGLPVSYDTILRGMLTPTEYRLTKKEIVTTTP